MSSYSVALAVQHAAEDAREQLLEVAAKELEIAPADLEIVDGVIRPVGSPDRGVEVSAIASRLAGFGSALPPIEGRGSAAPGELAPSTAAHAVHVKVDAETGEVRVLGYVMAQDCGRALNPALVEGQMIGAAAQGVGWALLEELAHDEDGSLQTGSFLSYALPSAVELPSVETILVEVPSPEGPFGARGVGEASLVGAPAAIANAVAAATGARPRQLPIAPARLLAALPGAG